MPEPVILIFAERVDQEGFRDVVESLNGVRDPDPYLGARLSRGKCHVWAYTREDQQDTLEPDQVAAYQARLGGPVGGQVVLDMSDAPGSERLVLELIEAVARRWHVVVDNNIGVVFTVEELRQRVAAGRRSVFGFRIDEPGGPETR
jgi:hypothetical protein